MHASDLPCHSACLPLLVFVVHSEHVSQKVNLRSCSLFHLKNPYEPLYCYQAHILQTWINHVHGLRPTHLPDKVWDVGVAPDEAGH